MICPYCGAEKAEETDFCASCGSHMTNISKQTGEKGEEVPETAILQSTNHQAEEYTPFEHSRPVRRRTTRRYKNHKALLFAVLGILCLVIGIAILVWFLDSSPYHACKHNILVEIDSGKVVILLDDKKPTYTDLEANRVTQHQSSLNGTVVAFLTDKSVLAVAQRNKLTVVAKNVSSFVLSVDGTGLGYVTKDSTGSYNTLKLYDLKSKSTSDITSEKANITFDLAPDGDSLAYCVQNDGQKTYSLAFYNGSKSIPIVDSIVTLIGLSNNGKYIYTVTRDGHGDKILYCYDQNGEKQLIGACNISVAYLNEDHTQILYYNSSHSGDERIYETYISTRGASGNQIASANSTASPLIPKNCMNFTTGTSVTVPMENLYNKVYGCWGETGQDIWMIRENSENSVKLASNAYYVTLSENAEYVYYKTGSDWYGTLMVLKVSHGAQAAEKAIALGEDVVNFVITSNSKKVYYQNKDGIYCVNGKTGNGKKTIVSGETELGIFKNGKDVVYYMIEGDVYASKNGQKGKLVLSDADHITSAANGIVYVFMDDDSLYATSSAKKPRLVWSED